MTEADITLPTIHFSKQPEYNLEWHRGRVERRKDNRQQWMAQEVANVSVDELAAQALDREFAAI